MKAAIIAHPGLDQLKIEDLSLPETGSGDHIGNVCIST